MGSVLAAFANGAIASAALTAAVWLALWLTPRHRLNAATRYAFWWTTLAATLALPALYLRTPRYERVTRVVSEPLPGEPRLQPEPTALPTAPRAANLPYKVSLQAPGRGAVLQSVAAVWLAVSFVLLVRLLVSWVLLDRRRARALPLPATLRAQAEKWLAPRRATRPDVLIASSTEIAIPVAVGPRHPSILIPARLLDELDDDDLGQIVLHEAAHLARRDDYALLAERVIEAAFALHPVVRWITRQMDLEREVACDDFVIAATGQARSYASCLTRMVELCGGVRTSLAGATAVNDRSHLAKRVDRLLDKTRHTGTRLLRARLFAMVAVLIAAAWMAGTTPGFVAFAMPQAPATIAAPAPPHQQPAVPARTPAVAGTSGILTAAAVPAPAPAAAPPEPPAPQSAPVRIPVSVTDPIGRFVTGLTQESFKIFEDGVEQQISQLSSEDLPISVGIVVDASGSMREKLTAERAAVSAFLKVTRPEDEFFLMPFSDEPELTVPFTHDPEAVVNGLEHTEARGGTALRSAIYQAIDEMKKARNSRRAILIVSDGTDNSSIHSAADMAATLREADPQIYAINLADRPDPRAFAGILEVVHDPTTLDGAADNVSAAPARASRIAAGLRNQYVLSYISASTARDGKYRRVQVQFVQPVGLPPLRVTYRAGYYAQ